MTAVAACPMSAQPRYFAGAGPGAAILSVDAKAVITPDSSSLSSYKPEYGLLFNAFAGWHVNDYFSLQGAWSWNRNGLSMASATTGVGSYEQLRDSSQHNLGLDGLLYFRNRSSFVRPFLSVGINHMWLTSAEERLLVRTGSALPPPVEFTAQEVGIRVAAGTDLMLRNGWGFRYAFLENIQRNPISRRLTPPGGGQLMNFQHIVAFLKYF